MTLFALCFSDVFSYVFSRFLFSDLFVRRCLAIRLFSDTGITDETGIALVEAIKVNKVLQSFTAYLYGNGFTDETGIALAEAIKVNKVRPIPLDVATNYPKLEAVVQQLGIMRRQQVTWRRWSHRVCTDKPEEGKFWLEQAVRGLYESQNRARSLAAKAQESDVLKKRDSLTESLGKMNWQLTSFGQENQPTAVLNDTSFEELRWAQFKTPQAQWGPPTSMRFVIECFS
jgi:hypothetical protein